MLSHGCHSEITFREVSQEPARSHRMCKCPESKYLSGAVISHFHLKKCTRKDFTSFFKIIWKPHQFWTVTFLFHPKVICFLCIDKLLFPSVHLQKCVFCFLLNRNSERKQIDKLLLPLWSYYAEGLTNSSEAWERTLFVLFLGFQSAFFCLFFLNSV